MIGDNLEQYTYEYLMQLALSHIPDDRDKRQGSIIYDALAPACQLLAAGIMEIKNFYTRTYAVTATDEDLDNRVAEQGVIRYSATYAVKKVQLADSTGNPVTVPPGTRFSTDSSTDPVNYTITAQYMEDGVIIPGCYEATCEEAGVVGNQYFGDLVNITFIQGLATATMSTTLIPARDKETDDELRERYFAKLNQKAFGGNVADYRGLMKSISGVGEVQIYPTWNGGGTVKISMIDPEYLPCSPEFVSSVQEKVDPENSQGVTGTGLGLAPIGHQVTVVTPDVVDMNITASIELQKGYVVSQVQPVVEQALEDLMSSLRRSWADALDLNDYACDVFVSKINATIVNVTGVANVSDILLNGERSDIHLIQSGEVQQIPMLGEVVLNV